MPFRSRPLRIRNSPFAALSLALLVSVAGCFGAAEPTPPMTTSVPSAATTKIDPSGHWCYAGPSGQNRTDAIELVQGGIIIGPVGRKGREIFYTEAGPNEYRHGSGGAYRFVNDDQAAWEGKDARRSLRRCG